MSVERHEADTKEIRTSAIRERLPERDAAAADGLIELPGEALDALGGALLCSAAGGSPASFLPGEKRKARRPRPCRPKVPLLGAKRTILAGHEHVSF